MWWMKWGAHLPVSTVANQLPMRCTEAQQQSLQLWLPETGTGKLPFTWVQGTHNCTHMQKWALKAAKEHKNCKNGPPFYQVLILPTLCCPLKPVSTQLNFTQSRNEGLVWNKSPFGMKIKFKWRGVHLGILSVGAQNSKAARPMKCTSAKVTGYMSLFPNTWSLQVKMYELECLRPGLAVWAPPVLETEKMQIPWLRKMWGKLLSWKME